MIAALACIPLLSAFIGWLTVWMIFKLLFHPRNQLNIGSLQVQGLLLKNEAIFKAQVTSFIKVELVAAAEKFASPATIEKLKPELNQHVDYFLKVKLRQRMPVVGMLIGERTINQLKEVFMEELESLFPTIMKNYLQQLPADVQPEMLIKKKLDEFPVHRIEKIFRQHFASDLRKLRFLATLTGFIIGCIQLLIIKISMQ